MANERNELLEAIEHLVEGPLSVEISHLSDEQIKLFHSVVEQVLEKERAGFDKFFESISQTLKYIPNFIVLAITSKYIEPPIAARITSKLPIKSAIPIAKGLSISYICKTAVFLDDLYAAELLEKLPVKKSRDIIKLLYETHPLRAVDILSNSSKALISLVSPPSELLGMEREGLSEHRILGLQKLEEEFFK